MRPHLQKGTATLQVTKGGGLEAVNEEPNGLVLHPAIPRCVKACLPASKTFRSGSFTSACDATRQHKGRSPDLFVAEIGRGA